MERAKIITKLNILFCFMMVRNILFVKNMINIGWKNREDRQIQVLGKKKLLQITNDKALTNVVQIILS